MLPVTQCLIHWRLHSAHGWWYTDEGGGHMVSFPGEYDTQHHCLGVFYIGRHRGTYHHKYFWTKTHPPKHRGLVKPEVDVDMGYSIE